jgi:hypothetical protein
MMSRHCILFGIQLGTLPRQYDLLKVLQLHTLFWRGIVEISIDSPYS